MRTSPFVSVVLPAFNAQAHLAEAIQSILSQTWSDFEIVIIDDGSTDETPGILQGLRALDGRIAVYRQAHSGISEALNTGINIAAGKYIARMDADDISLPDRLTKQVQYMETHPACCALACRVALIDDVGSRAGVWSDDVECLTFDQIRRRLRRRNCISHPSTVIRTSLAKQYKYDGDQIDCEDYDLWLRLVSDGKIIWKLDEALLLLRVHAGSIIAKANETSRQDLRDIRTRGVFLRKRFMARKISRFDLEVLASLTSDVTVRGAKSLKRLWSANIRRAWFGAGPIAKKE